jgi:DNA repair exonuclease SbcCD ATPase subunit
MPEDLIKQEKHVTDLVGPDDRWVSVTDASRIGRRQEHTIRTWIAQGLLPVNPERVGINKKTRQVRLSDLAKLTPIIDPDAGIATDLGTLDLPSIPKQQQQLLAQMTMLQQEVAGQLASLGEQLHELAGKQEHFAEETRQTWHVTQQQYQALAHRDEEQQQLIQQVRDSLTERLQELTGQLEQYQRLTEQVLASYSQALQQVRQDLSALVIETEKTLRQALSDQVGQSEAALRQALEAVRKIGEGETQQVRQNVADLGAAIWGAHEELQATVFRLDAHTDQQFSQVASCLEPLETTLGQQREEIQKQVGRVGQLATQLTGLQSTWQERAMTAEQEARQLRRDLDAQGRLQQALQQQFDEERKAREELAQQVSQRLPPSPQKGKGQE